VQEWPPAGGAEGTQEESNVVGENEDKPTVSDMAVEVPDACEDLAVQAARSRAPEDRHYYGQPKFWE